VSVALVTGAARGLGAAIARHLATLGWSVAVNDLPGVTAADSVVAGIVDGGGIAVAAPADVTDEDQVTELAARVADQLGPIGALVVNATGPQPMSTVDKLTWRAHLDQLELFVKSPTILLQAVLPGMRAMGEGRIVHIGSDMVDRALPGWSAYAAAKSAEATLTRCWAREVGPDNITVNLVAPGWIPVERHAGTPAAELDRYVADVPLGRIGTPHDVAATVAFLLSAEASFITGQCLRVNGGHADGSHHRG
jgi:3-oxoacyl-[acyl-carrier protein] reductase